MKKLFEGIIIVVIFMIFVVLVVGFIFDRLILVFYVYFESMMFMINKGDFFFINFFLRNVEVGDIIVFYRRDGWIVYRVYVIVDGKYIIKGDYNVVIDQQDGVYFEVEYVDIVGKVVQILNYFLVIRGGGDFIVNFRKRLMNVYVIVIIVIFGGLFIFFGSLKERSRRRLKCWRFIRIQGKIFYGIVLVFIILGFLVVIIVLWGMLVFMYFLILVGGQIDGWYLFGIIFEKNFSVENYVVYLFYYFFKDDSGRVELKIIGFCFGGGEVQNFSFIVIVLVDIWIYREEVFVWLYLVLLFYSLINWVYLISLYFLLVLYLILFLVLMFVFYWIFGILGEMILIRKGKILFKLMGDGRL